MASETVLEFAWAESHATLAFPHPCLQQVPVMELGTIREGSSRQELQEEPQPLLIWVHACALHCKDSLPLEVLPLAASAQLLAKGPVLVLAGVELIFCTVACMGLCFGFVLEAVLITQGCFCYC